MAEGRWPPNILLSHTPECGEACAEVCAVAEMDRQSGVSKSVGGRIGNKAGIGAHGIYGAYESDAVKGDPGYGDTGGASRFFPVFRYQAKASRSERDSGLSDMERRRCGGMTATANGSMLTGSGNERTTSRANHHPTVKPVELMRWLVRLVTPSNGVVLDPFTGSGTTGVAAMLEGAQFVGIEREPEYHAIASARIQHATESRAKVRESTPVTGDLFNRSA